MAQSEASEQDLPPFPAAREFARRYADEPTVWVLIIVYISLNVGLAIGMANSLSSPFWESMRALAGYGVGVWMLSGFYWALWCDMRRGAKEREVTDADE